LINFRPPGEAQEPTVSLKEGIKALTGYLVNDVHGSDFVGHLE